MARTKQVTQRAKLLSRIKHWEQKKLGIFHHSEKKVCPTHCEFILSRLKKLL